MTITFTSYPRLDGLRQLHIKRSNYSSVVLSPKRGWEPYGKFATPGKRNTMDAALAVFADNSKPFTGDPPKHPKAGGSAQVECGPFTLTRTDAGKIGGMAVEAVGSYVICNGRIVRCGVAFEE